MKAIMLSINANDCELIVSGKKSLVICRTEPKLERPSVCYVYHTKTRNAGVRWNDWADCLRLPNGEFINAGGKVIGEFVCCGIMHPFSDLRFMAKQSCLSVDELLLYSHGKTPYGLRVADFKLYDKPKELGDFRKACQYAKCEKENCPHALVKITDRINLLTGEQEFYALDGKPKWDVEFIGCANKLTRPPRTWQYVQTL
ncbi:MAG: hypothetical protein K2J01_06680 [Clostridiales bacterium]|nr:hypothetical protein [Clostridiales bacterium]